MASTISIGPYINSPFATSSLKMKYNISIYQKDFTVENNQQMATEVQASETYHQQSAGWQAIKRLARLLDDIIKILSQNTIQPTRNATDII